MALSKLGASARNDDLRNLFAVYAGLARCFQLSTPPCALSEDAGVIRAVQRWVEQLDRQVEVHQLRLFLQTTATTTQENLRTLIRHHMAGTGRTTSDRDKLDFLLVQYVYCCTPVSAAKAVDAGAIANELRPILGQVAAIPHSLLEAIEEILRGVGDCRSLSQLLDQDCFKRGRTLKESVGNKFWEPQALVAFTWLNFILRRSCFHLLYADMEALRGNLRLLNQHGIQQVDCRGARMSDAEPVASLYRICEQWSESFRAPYAAGRPLAQFAAVCSSVAAALSSAVSFPNAPPRGAVGFRPGRRCRWSTRNAGLP